MSSANSEQTHRCKTPWLTVKKIIMQTFVRALIVMTSWSLVNNVKSYNYPLEKEILGEVQGSISSANSEQTHSCKMSWLL
jgi:hypothetical protein